MTTKKRYRKEWKVLINPTWSEQVEREPLLAFSFYLSTRNNQLTSVADNILDLLDSGISDKRIDYGLVGEAGTLMWFWTLGAYEIIRTICQAKTCFSESYINKALNLKKILAKVRMPDAKMEKQGKKEPVTSNRSPFAEDVEKKDLIIGDPFDPLYAREIIDLYFSVIDAITPSDVLKPHEESYK
jgi:hypothetical protein